MTAAHSLFCDIEQVTPVRGSQSLVGYRKCHMYVKIFHKYVDVVQAVAFNDFGLVYRYPLSDFCEDNPVL